MTLSRLATISVALVLCACSGDNEGAPPATTPVVSDNAVVTEDPFRLSPDIAPIAQQVTLNIDPRETGYSGSTRIDIDVDVDSPNIRLHAEDMQITAVRLMSGDQAIDVAHEPGEHGLLILNNDAGFPAGSYVLEIEFENDFNVDGVGIARTEIDGESYIFSQFQSIDAREAIPCFDEPGFKFPWQLTMTVPTDVTPITNTPEVSVTENGETKTVVFDTTPPLPSYLIAVVVGPYEFVPIEGMSIPGRVAVPKGKTALAAAAVDVTPPLLAYLEDYFGQPYPFKKLDLIAVNPSFSGAMEHPGAVTYSDFFLLLDENASASDRTTLIRITAHELAHQWFGNLVTMQWWNDLWLNESFADWMGDKAAAAVFPEYSAELSQLRTLFFIMDGDAEAQTEAIRRDFSATDNFEEGIFLSYFKGKSVLGMFEEAVGAELFRDGVIRYLRKYDRGNAIAANLWAEINAGAEFDLAGALSSFIDQPGVPLVTVSSLGGGRYQFSQSRIVTGGAEIEQSWIIPLSYRYATGDSIQTATLIIDEPSEVVDLNEDVDWILPNADERSYLRWSVPEAMLMAMGEDASTHLNIRERMGLLSNLWALLGADQLDGDEYLAAMRTLADDVDADVLAALISQLPGFRETFITPDLQPDFAAFVDDLLTPAVERFGTTPLPDDSNAVANLRPRVLASLAIYAENESARAVVEDTVAEYLAGDRSMSAAVEFALRTLPRWSSDELLNTYKDRIATEASPGVRRTLVRGLANFRDPAVVDQVLDYVLNDDVLRAGEKSLILSVLFQAEELNATMVDWAMQNDATLRNVLPEGELVQIPGRLMLCSAENIEEISDFYLAPERAVGGIEDQIAYEAAEKRSCAAFRAREIDSVRAYLSAN